MTKEIKTSDLSALLVPSSAFTTPEEANNETHRNNADAVLLCLGLNNLLRRLGFLIDRLESANGRFIMMAYI